MKTADMSVETKAKPRRGRPPVLLNAVDRILDEAAELFGEGGYDKSSISDVSDRLGITKAAVFHYFPTKQSIYDAIIMRTLEGLAAAVKHEVDSRNGAEDKLRGFMKAHAGYFERNYWSFVCMLVGYGGMASSNLKSEVNRLRVDYEKLLRVILKDGMESGTFRKADVTMTSHAILSMLNWMVRWFKPGGKRTAEWFAAEYYGVVTQGLLQETPRKSGSKAK